MNCEACNQEIIGTYVTIVIAKREAKGERKNKTTIYKTEIQYHEILDAHCYWSREHDPVIEQIKPKESREPVKQPKSKTQTEAEELQAIEDHDEENRIDSQLAKLAQQEPPPEMETQDS